MKKLNVDTLPLSFKLFVDDIENLVRPPGHSDIGGVVVGTLSTIVDSESIGSSISEYSSSLSVFS